MTPFLKAAIFCLFFHLIQTKLVIVSDVQVSQLYQSCNIQTDIPSKTSININSLKKLLIFEISISN